MHFPSVCPEIPVSDLTPALAYYRDQLGFKIDWSAEQIGLACLSRGDTRIFMTTAEYRSVLGVRGPIVLWLNLAGRAEVDALHGQWAAAGARIADPPEAPPTTSSMNSSPKTSTATISACSTTSAREERFKSRALPLERLHHVDAGVRVLAVIRRATVDDFEAVAAVETNQVVVRHLGGGERHRAVAAHASDLLQPDQQPSRPARYSASPDRRRAGRDRGRRPAARSRRRRRPCRPRRRRTRRRGQSRRAATCSSRPASPAPAGGDTG